MKIDGAYKSLLQGVSQQPPRDRLPGQCRVQTNMLSDPVKSLTRRPPTDLVGLLGASTSIKGWHTFTSKNGQKFLIWFTNNTMRIFDLNGNEKTVAFDAGVSSFLSTAGTIRCFTDEDDTTICVNDGQVPAMLSDTPAYMNTGVYAGIVQVLGGQYGKTYRIYINGTAAASYKTPDGSQASESNNVATTYIALQLYSSFNYTGCFISIQDDVLVIWSNTVSFTVTATDGVGNVNIKAMNQSVPDTGDLPRIAPHKYVARVAEKSDPEKDLWFQFLVEGHESDSPTLNLFGRAGYWQECVAPNVPYKLNKATMPCVLTYNGTSFTLSQGEWEDRKVGTLVSNPNPTFIGKRIRDVSSFQGRTVFIAGSNVIMSRTNRPYDFWFGSASALTDTDPVDINSSVDGSNMVSLIQHNRDLVVFSNNAQFIVYGKQRATAETAALTLTTKFQSEPGAKPVGAGRNVFFAANYGKYTAIREFFTEGGTEINDSRPVTQHAKEYIVGTAKHLACSSNYDMLLVHTDTDRNVVYVYQYIWADQEKVLSAWHKWEFPYEVVYSFFDEDMIYSVHKIAGQYYLVRLPLDVQNDADLEYPVHLDYRFDITSITDNFTLPYAWMNSNQLVAVQATGCPTPGLPARIKAVTGTTVQLKRSMNGGNLIAGLRYQSEYSPTLPFVKDADGVVIGTGSLRLSHFMLSLSKTGKMYGQALTKYGDGPVVTYTARTVGDVDNLVGEEAITDGKFIMPFRLDVEQADVLFYTDSHTPMTILDIEYKGQYNKKGRRITGTGG